VEEFTEDLGLDRLLYGSTPSSPTGHCDMVDSSV
jgi:hypothetical protein